MQHSNSFSHEQDGGSLTDKGLARLAELAEAVSRHKNSTGGAPDPAMKSTTVNVPSFPNNNDPFQGVSNALRKRPYQESHQVPTVEVPPKRMKGPDPSLNGGSQSPPPDNTNVRFREYQAEIWSEKFEDLCEFRKTYGHCHVPHTYAQNGALAQWVKRQRYQYKLKLEGKRSTLSDDRVHLLNTIGFIWNSHDVVWDERWHELLAFQRQHGHCVVPSNYEPNPQLAVWVKRQRRQYKFYQEKASSSMTPERIDKLNQIGFAWDCRKAIPLAQQPPGSLKHSLPKPDTFLQGTTPPTSASSTKSNVTTTVLRSGGFPLPSITPQSPNPGKTPSIQRPANNTVPRNTQRPSSDNNSPNVARATSTTNTVSIPCEFFSFSRKFNKFPKTDFSKFSP
eukprot:Nitzschia sp. Nitz4//scaffold145_size56662//7061//8339//NITZ4_006552-RA/size56662-snap-gene-0.85-mRNA-1//1//CDS//3329536562//5085//frame0